MCWARNGSACWAQRLNAVLQCSRWTQQREWNHWLRRTSHQRRERLFTGEALGVSPFRGPLKKSPESEETGQDWRKRRRMVGGRGGGVGRRQERQALMVAFAVALLMGTAVYFRIWARQSNDPSFTADDREELRRQFERANLEAMDESAEWRMKYDTEFEKNRQLQDELLKVKASLSASTRRFDLLQKDNQMLKKQIESMKLPCNCSVPLNLTQQ